jgi:hypothetical protein
MQVYRLRVSGPPDAVPDYPENEPEGLAAAKAAKLVVVVAPGAVKEAATPTIPSKPVANNIAPFVPTLKGKTVAEPRES